MIGTLILAFFLLTAAGIGPAHADPFKVGSGKVLDILSIKAEKTAKGRALVMRFGTRTPLSELAALRMEADELWEHFIVNVEKGKFVRAVIRAANRPKGGKTVDFVYLKRGSDWRTLEKGLGPSGKLTSAFVKALYEQRNQADQRANRNLILLYTSRDWRITYAYPSDLGIGPIEFDRETFLGLVERTGAAISKRNYKMHIMRIRIAPDGMSAIVETAAKGDATIRGRVVSLRGRVIDALTLRDGALFSSGMAMRFDEIFEGLDQ